MEKICIIGPSYPFRGGIAHYTTLLYRAMKTQYNVKFYAFKRQYPKCLYPGRNDKDVSNVGIKEDDVENILDSMNPITWWKTFYRIKKDDPDLLIIPWWVSFWTPQFWSITTLVRRFTLAKVLFICHNVVQHESSRIDKFCTRLVLRKGDFFIVHSEEDLHNLRQTLPKAQIRKSFHPTYDIFKSEDITKEAARKKLGIQGRTLLFFGFVRPYKGLNYLIEALPKVLKKFDVTLLVVGEFWKGKDDYLNQIRDLKLDDRVKIFDEYVPNERIGNYFCAADVVMLPYVSATGSGIAQIAFGFNKPVIATDVGCLPEVIENGKTGFVVSAKNPIALSNAIIRFYEEDREGEFSKNISKENKKCSWNRMVETIESFSTDKDSI